MRDGYKRELNTDYDCQFLIDPKGEPVAVARLRGSNPYATITSTIYSSESLDVKDRDELRRLFATIADKHYMSTTTPWQRFRHRTSKVLGDPIWGFFAFVAAAVGAGASLLGLIN